ncbi:MAG: hypothetical protein F6K17_10350 [Okeania sp. SIO3C4]|nr:hypothetical protein [Okeania sp. SIO3C4]
MVYIVVLLEKSVSSELVYLDLHSILISIFFYATSYKFGISCIFLDKTRLALTISFSVPILFLFCYVSIRHQKSPPKEESKHSAVSHQLSAIAFS